MVRKNRGLYSFLCSSQVLIIMVPRNSEKFVEILCFIGVVAMVGTGAWRVNEPFVQFSDFLMLLAGNF